MRYRLTQWHLRGLVAGAAGCIYGFRANVRLSKLRLGWCTALLPSPVAALATLASAEPGPARLAGTLLAVTEPAGPLLSTTGQRLQRIERQASDRM